MSLLTWTNGSLPSLLVSLITIVSLFTSFPPLYQQYLFLAHTHTHPFSPPPDGSMFATGSGDAETGIPQLLVFDTTTAQLVVNTTLPGLGAALGAKDNLFDIWSVDFD
jgi:hypothetical protein